MDLDSYNFLQTFFQQIWKIFTSVQIPGTNITAGMALIGFFGIEVFASFIHKVMDSGSAPSLHNIGKDVDYLKERHQAYKQEHVKYDSLPPADI